MALGINVNGKYFVTKDCSDNKTIECNKLIK
jgi:hypothetical protein